MGAGASSAHDKRRLHSLLPGQKAEIVEHFKRTMERTKDVQSNTEAEKIIAEQLVTDMTREVNKALMEHSTENRGENDEDMPSNGLDNAPVQGIAMQAVDEIEQLSKQVMEFVSPRTGQTQDFGMPLSGDIASKTANFRQRRLTFAKQRQASRHLPPEITTHLYSSHEIGEMTAAPAPFPSSKLGTYSCHGIEPSWEDEDGFVEKINQDRGCVVHPFHKSSREALLCVYDGHGEHGDLVSQYVMTEVAKRLERHPQLTEDPTTALTEVFIAVNHALEEEASKGETFMEPMFSGCTAVVVYVLDDVMWVANTGDSRAVLCVKHGDSYRAVNLTRDHNPDAPIEHDRILAAGGFVSPPPEDGLSARVWLDQEFTQIGLAMSRSIGDHAVKHVGVIPDPEVVRHQCVPEDYFVILATDGVWEFIDSQEAVEIVSAHMSEGVEIACQKLIGTAAGRWQDVEGDYRDDITAIIVTLPLFPQTIEEQAEQQS